MNYKVIKQRTGGPKIGTITGLQGKRFCNPHYLGFRFDTTEMKNEYLEEVIERKVADSREDLKEIEGYYVDDCSDLEYHESEPNEGAKNTRKTEEQAEASLAQSQLSQLRAYTRKQCGDWKADWNDGSQKKWVIYYYYNEISTSNFINTNTFLSFPTPEVRDEFFEKHYDLIQLTLPLYS